MPEKTQLGMPLKVKNLCGKYNPSSMILNMDNRKTFTSHIVENIYKASTEHQVSLKKVNQKPNFYNIFKTDNKKADFLDRIKDPLHRSAVSKLCLGNHSLYIETGRHTVPKTPEHLRTCTLCQLNNIENETHVLFSCTLYNALCSKFYDEVVQKYNFFQDLNITSKLLFLFDNIDPFIYRSLAAFVYDVRSYRNSRLFLIK